MCSLNIGRRVESELTTITAQRYLIWQTTATQSTLKSHFTQRKLMSD
jgi:hypothetical protein